MNYLLKKLSKLDNNTIRVTINNGQITTSKSIKQSDSYNMHGTNIKDYTLSINNSRLSKFTRKFFRK